MGFAAAEIERAITGLKRNDDPTTIVQRGTSRPGERIPNAGESSTQLLQLDRAAIAEIVRDTNDVTEMLAAAMGNSTDELPASEPLPLTTEASPVSPAAKQIPPGEVSSATDRSLSLPERYSKLFKLLIEQQQWTLADAEILARKQGLMLGGAIEAINDWSFEVHGGPLFIEEPDRLLVETALLH